MIILSHIVWIGVNNVNINESLGILYDTLFYNVVYFNRRAVETTLSSLTHKKPDAYLYNYDSFRIKKNLPNPPDSLYPFFTTVNTIIVFSQNWFWKKQNSLGIQSPIFSKSLRTSVFLNSTSLLTISIHLRMSICKRSFWQKAKALRRR